MASDPPPNYHGGSILPEPANEVELKVFHGGGLAESEIIGGSRKPENYNPETILPEPEMKNRMKVFKGGSYGDYKTLTSGNRVRSDPPKKDILELNLEKGEEQLFEDYLHFDKNTIKEYIKDSGHEAEVASKAAEEAKKELDKADSAINVSTFKAKMYFEKPGGIALGPDGTLYVADSENHTINAIDKDGKLSIFAGAPADVANKKGCVDGLGTAARFNNPNGLILFGDALFVCDTDNHCIRKVFIADRAAGAAAARQKGEVIVFAGQPIGMPRVPGNIDLPIGGAVGTERFNKPMGICKVDLSFYITDSGNNIIRYITYNDARPDVIEQCVLVLGTVGDITPGYYQNPANKQECKFNNPTAIFSKNTGFIAISDSGNNVIRIFDYTNAFNQGIIGPLPAFGAGSVDPAAPVGPYVPGEAGYVDTNSTNPLLKDVRFNNPMGLFMIDTYIYICDTGNNCIRKIIRPAPVVVGEGPERPTMIETVSGNPQAGNADGSLTDSRFNNPTSIIGFIPGDKLDTRILYVTDSNNHTIRRIVVDEPLPIKQSNVDANIAANAAARAAAVAAGQPYPLHVPLVVDPTVDPANFPFGKDKEVSSLKGDFIRNPTAIAYDKDIIYVCDSTYHTVTKVTRAGDVEKFGRDGIPLTINGIRKDSRFNTPMGITISDSIVYITQKNNVIRTIQDNNVGTFSAPKAVVTAITAARGAVRREATNMDVNDAIIINEIERALINIILITTCDTGKVLPNNSIIIYKNIIRQSAQLIHPPAPAVAVEAPIVAELTRSFSAAVVNSIAIELYKDSESVRGSIEDVKVHILAIPDNATTHRSIELAGRLRQLLSRAADYNATGAMRNAAHLAAVAALDALRTPAVAGNPGGAEAEAAAVSIEVADAIITGSGINKLREIRQKTIDIISEDLITAARKPIVQIPLGDIANLELNAPTGITAKDATLYIANTGGRNVQQITTAIPFTQSSIGTGVKGNLDGPIATAKFNKPTGITVNTGIIYVSDITDDNKTFIRRIKDGNVDTLNKVAFDGELSSLTSGIDVYGTSKNKHQIINIKNGEIRSYSPIFEAGNTDGHIIDARFYTPSGIFIKDDEAFVADAENHLIRIITGFSKAEKARDSVAGLVIEKPGKSEPGSDKFYYFWKDFVKYDGTNNFVLSNTDIGRKIQARLRNILKWHIQRLLKSSIHSKELPEDTLFITDVSRISKNASTSTETVAPAAPAPAPAAPASAAAAAAAADSDSTDIALLVEVT